jgi:hypothetical protein
MNFGNDAKPAGALRTRKIGLRAAIDAKCRDCIYDPKCGGGTWREQVAQCSAISCPLWPVRPEPKSGPFENCPRDPATVSQEWLAKRIGEALSPPLADYRPPDHLPGEGAREHDLRMGAP